MGKIENFNCDGLCSEKFCSKKYTYFIEKELGGMKVLINLCENHYEEILNEELKRRKEI